MTQLVEVLLLRPEEWSRCTDSAVCATPAGECALCYGRANPLGIVHYLTQALVSVLTAQQLLSLLYIWLPAV